MDDQFLIIRLTNNDLKIRFEQYARKTKKAVLGDSWACLHTDVSLRLHDGDVTG